MKISKYLFLFGSLYLFSPIDAQDQGEDLNFKVNEYYSSSFFNLLVQTKSCDLETSEDLFFRKKGIEQALLKTVRDRGGIEIEAIISTQPKDDLQRQMLCGDNNKGEKNYVIQMQAICTAPDINNERCNEMFVDTDTKDFANQLNNELDNIQNADDEKGFLINVKTASLERTDDSDFLDATRCNREQNVCSAGLVDKDDKTCCGFPGCECDKTSLTFCQYLCKYNIADCSENCQEKYVDDKFGNFLCDNIDVGTRVCLQPRRGVFLDGFITPVLELGDLVLNEPSNEEECKVELYKNSPTYEGFTYIIDANTNVKTCHFYRKEQLKTKPWLRFVASNVLNTEYMNAISFLDDSTNSPSNSPSVSPTASPSNQPSTNPTQNPTEIPTDKPSPRPTRNPSGKPTKNPTNPVGNFLCGISLEDASLCNGNDVCPSGSDSECALGQSCYEVEVCDNHFCGISLDDASKCNDNKICPSGSDSDCVLGQSCYGVEVCKNHFCGVSLDDASLCNDNDICPSGSDSECALGQSCYGVEVCNKHFCGISLDDASLCNSNDVCPSGSDSECVLGQSCLEVNECTAINCASTKSGKAKTTKSGKCKKSKGSKSKGSKSAKNPPNPVGNFLCGISLEDASLCNGNDVCPSGSDSECALGQSCYEVEVCDNHFCGISLDDASKCNDNKICPSGSDSDCVLGQSCYGVEVCKNHFCGVSLDDASLCNDNDICPSGSDSECALGQSCYGVEVCNKHFCGISLDDASLCNSNDVCPSGSDSECVLGQSCLEVNECTAINCASTKSGKAKTTKSGKCKKSKESKSGKIKKDKSGKSKNVKSSKMPTSESKVKKSKSGNEKTTKKDNEKEKKDNDVGGKGKGKGKGTKSIRNLN